MCELVSFNAFKDISNLRDEMNQRLDLIQHQLDSLLAKRVSTPQRGGGKVDPPQESDPPLASSASYVVEASTGKLNLSSVSPQ